MKCKKCNGEMLLYKVVYRNKNGELREYGGIDMFVKKITGKGTVLDEKEEKQKETPYEKTADTKHYQVCLY
ncbi:hypothetical protein [Pseudobacteroides cellulosolvens]|uniref:Uncharacterized protein n=1 Tax=Pseudobacteroides cellulosolvens ATCC 35603 = DSM 2933 TaxID=398512 RepID=A0A0L6JK63_9FIRM|nr:hypothetical protein [Pseudobacteroides cellulosolvens]KNY26108.1 hypothetical protein Bccel_1370 [Pseudobacteroides cellulosolvens ATCC 35603 = DSM 2933]